MNLTRHPLPLGLISAWILALLAGGTTAPFPARADELIRSPREIVGAPDGSVLYVVEATAHRISLLDPETGRATRHIALPGAPGGLALSPEGRTLYVTRAAPDGAVWVVDAGAGEIRTTIPVGHTPVAVAVSRDGKTLYVCNQFDHDVSVVDPEAGRETGRIPVRREPVAAALTPDGGRLVVANLLPIMAANLPYVSAEVSIIDPAGRTCLDHVMLPNGSQSVQGVCVSPDGRFAYVTHILSRYQVPTTQLERGWMNTNAMSILDLVKGTLLNTVLLDGVDRGAANPWGITVSADGRFICVTHAGSHELSIIHRAGLHEKLEQLARGEATPGAARSVEDVPNDLAFLGELRRRVALDGCLGPRGVALLGDTAYVTGYFSDSLSVVPLGEAPAVAAAAWSLGPMPDPTPTERRGELFFHDASRCFQQWQSCVSCHPGSRADALNWDLLNDGIGNPKNTKSMLLAHRTPPAMISGIRDRAEVAVRAGIRYIQFAVATEEDASAIDAYLSSLTPVPSPALEEGELSEAARRGQRVFAEAGCMECHPPPLYTDLQQHHLGTGIGQDKAKAWDTPALNECWRTAPYLYDGRAATLTDLLVEERHGLFDRKLSSGEVTDLVEFVRSL